MFYEMIGFMPPDAGAPAGEPPVPDLARTALFLDFDGTLAPIAARPDDVVVGAGVQRLLATLHARAGGAVALVSGRPCAALEAFLPGFAGPVFGAHGAERHIAGNWWRHPLTGSRQVAQLTYLARGFAALDDGFLLEEKPTGVVLHYRKNPSLDSEAFRFFESLTGHFPDFEVHPAKLAVEMRPKGASKRDAVVDCMAEPPFSGRLPAYFGDDKTDEPALAWVAEQGGIAVKVGHEASQANYRLGGVEEVLATLEGWARAKTGAECPDG